MAKVLLRGAVSLLCVVLAAGAVQSLASDEPTVGSFLQRLASLNRLDATEPLAAARALRAAGYRLPEQLDYTEPLTEARVVAITRAMGLGVTTNRPLAPFDGQQVDRLLHYFEFELGGGDAANLTEKKKKKDKGKGDQGHEKGKGPPFDPYAKGKGKGGTVTPTDP